MAEHSPTPWQVRYNDTVADAIGAKVAACWRPANAALIVEAVNERDRLRDLVRRLAEYIRHSVCDCEGPWQIDITSSGDGDYHANANDLLREAREALGEAQQ